MENTDIQFSSQHLARGLAPELNPAFSPKTDREFVPAFSDNIEDDDNSPKKHISEETPSKELPRSANILFLSLTGIVFLAFTAVFLFFPRTEYSELEKRELALFPDVEKYSGNPAGLTAAISQWFSDSEPFRDDFMTLSMNIRNAMRITIGAPEEAVTFRPSAPVSGSDAIPGGANAEPSHPLVEGVDNPLADENAKVGNSGTLIVGSGSNVRALMAYGGSANSGKSFVEVVNAYADAFPAQHVYALVAPLATEFYLPEKAAKCSNPQRPTIETIRQSLSPKVRFVDAYSALAAHVDEDIYLRTDHHWAPLGGYYAAREIARSAGVPFHDLSGYDRHVIHNFVGSMYGYSKDISIKNAPEDFVYYTPKGLDYKTTFIIYNTNKDYQVVSESKPFQGNYFKSFKDGSGNAYLTFMGSDQQLVKVVTGTPGKRRVLFIKDSYGNALPGYLFYSFNEVHVVDFRYFKRNMKQYVADNHITDIVIAFNVFNVCSHSAAQKIRNFLTQASGSFAAETPHVRDSVKRTDSPTEKKAAKTGAAHKASRDSIPAIEPAPVPAPVESEPVHEPETSE